MPELPEVQALVADLGARLIGDTLVRVDVTSFAALKTFDPPISALEGGTFVGADRHGKFLDLTIATIDSGDLHLVFNLALAGWMHWRTVRPKPSPTGRSGPLAARILMRNPPPGAEGYWSLDVTEWGTKKSLAIWVVRSPSDVPRIAALGPDPMTPAFTEEVFASILAARGRERIKGVLRNQNVIAGIGNAYSDEILHAAKMSPFKPADMAPDEVSRLYAAMRETLAGARARADGVAAAELKAEKKSNLQVHGRNGLPCPVCGDTVRQVIYADSTFQYCPTCQTGGKPLADRVLSRLLK